MVVNLKYKLRQVDAKNVFLQGELTEIVHINAQSPRYFDPKYPNHICWLNKAIYMA